MKQLIVIATKTLADLLKEGNGDWATVEIRNNTGSVTLEKFSEKSPVTLDQPHPGASDEQEEEELTGLNSDDPFGETDGEEEEEPNLATKRTYCNLATKRTYWVNHEEETSGVIEKGDPLDLDDGCEIVSKADHDRAVKDWGRESPPAKTTKAKTEPQSRQSRARNSVTFETLQGELRSFMTSHDTNARGELKDWITDELGAKNIEMVKPSDYQKILDWMKNYDE